MKVYFVVKEPSKTINNYFVYSLGNALERHGCEVRYGLALLWEDEVLSYDIIHFQWPEGIFGLFKHKVSDKELSDFTQRITYLRQKGRRMVATCHNLKPHTNSNENVIKLYDVIYKNVDCIIHMGDYSYELMKPQYPKASHLIIPHHLYDDVYNFSYTKEDARRSLGIPLGQIVILSFGKFRTNKERHLVLSLKSVCPKAFLFLMPGFYRETLHTKNPIKLIKRIAKTLYYRLKRIRFSNDIIPDDDMQRYFCAADVVLLQRLDILNSGNLPMAFAAGKVVVGGNIGNIGVILNSTGNPVFDPCDLSSIKSAVFAGIEMAQNGKGEENRLYAIDNWTSNKIAYEHIQCYKGLM